MKKSLKIAKKRIIKLILQNGGIVDFERTISKEYVCFVSFSSTSRIIIGYSVTKRKYYFLTMYDVVEMNNEHYVSFSEIRKRLKLYFIICRSVSYI